MKFQTCALINVGSKWFFLYYDFLNDFFFAILKLKKYLNGGYDIGCVTTVGELNWNDVLYVYNLKAFGFELHTLERTQTW